MYTFWTETDHLRKETKKTSMFNWKKHLWTEEVVSDITFPAPATQHRLSSPGSFTTIHTLDPPFQEKMVCVFQAGRKFRGDNYSNDMHIGQGVQWHVTVQTLSAYKPIFPTIQFRTEKALLMRGKTSEKPENWWRIVSRTNVTKSKLFLI